MVSKTKPKKKLSLPMLHNASGRASASFTMVWIVFNLVALWLFLYIITPITGLQVPEFDGASAMLVLSPLCATYFAGQWRNGIQKKDEEES